MSERRFTRLKASLSEHGTAAKTRETVSRGLRQSLNSNNDSLFLSYIDNDYENNVRKWSMNGPTLTESSKASEEVLRKFLIEESDDIKCLDEAKTGDFDFNKYYQLDLNQITSSFSLECIKHYTDSKHLVSYAQQKKYYGTSLDSFTSSKSSSDFGEMFTSKSFLSNFNLRPHLFECDEDELESGVCGQKMLIREGRATVIDENEGSDFVKGWLTLSRDEHNCFLTFCDTSKRNKILWHIEVIKKVHKISNPIDDDDKDNSPATNSCFRVSKHLIHTDYKFIDDWIKDINLNISEDFDAESEMNRILDCDSESISENLKSFDLINKINVFAAYHTQNHRNDLITQKNFDEFNSINNSVNLNHSINSKSHTKHHQSNQFSHPPTSNLATLNSSPSESSGKLFRFLLGIKSTDIVSNANLKNNFIESYFYRISLFDCKVGKISEEFRYVVSQDIRTIRASKIADQNRGFDQRIMSTISKALFAFDLDQHNPNDLYLVLRVERTSHRLQNFFCIPSSSAVNNSCQNIAPNNSIHNNSSNYYHKTPKQSIISQHLEPYAWSVRPLFLHDSLNLETKTNFGCFYKMDSNRLSDEFICNVLNQVSQSLSQRSQTVVSGRLEVEILDYNLYLRQSKNENNDVLFNSSLFAQKPILEQKSNQVQLITPILEIQSLRSIPKTFNEYYNILYIYPQSLRFESQKIFSKARNLCVTIEIRDNDVVNESKPLEIIFGRPHDSSMFVTTASTAVSKHNVLPDFFEEIKVALPLKFSDKLHILFTFSHISCKKECSFSIVGYSWLPISSEKRQIHCQNLLLSVFASLPNNYLACQSLGLGKGFSMPDVKVVGKDIFRLSLRLTSSVISRDFELHNTLLSVVKITQSNRDDSKEISSIISLERQLPKMLRNLNECDPNELIHFSQIIIQQLFKLIVFAASQELIQESLNTIIFLVEKFRQENQLKILNEFIQSTFQTAEFCGVYIHDQLIVLVNKMTETFAQKSTAVTDDLKHFLKNIWFLLRIILKSMAQYLIKTDRIKLKREERFDEEFSNNLKSFLEQSSILISTYSRTEEAQEANRALAHFMTRLCSFFDRSIIFNAFYHHVNILSSRDIVIQELKFHSIATLLSHEHFVPYCNPLILQDSPSLSTEFSAKHFPVFLILNEFKSLYQQSATSVRQIRQLALSIIRNQLTKHMLDDRYSDQESREYVLTLYFPILSVILENSYRMVDSTVSSNPNTFAKNRSLPTNLKSSLSPSFGTIHEQQPILTEGLNSLLHRSISEISSTLSSVSSVGSMNSSSTINSTHTLTHSRSNSNVSTVRFDKFSHEEVRDLFVCFLCIVQVMNVDRMNLLSKKQLKDLFLCLECSLNCFEYKPKKLIDNRSKTLPNPMTINEKPHSTMTLSTRPSTSTSNPVDNTTNITNCLLQQNLSIQSALITLRTIHLYLDNDQQPIDYSVTQILSIYLTLLTLPQSQSVLINLFNSLRYFVHKFSIILFSSDVFLSPIISKVIKYCNSSLTPIRHGATDLLYCLFAHNLKRTRFETIVCVSRLASSDTHGLIYLHSSLNRLEQLALVEMKNQTNNSTIIVEKPRRSLDREEEEEITIINIIDRIREILKATKQIREDHFDPYSASELRLQLANSYSKTSRSLLRTWLENLSEVHARNHDWAEAAMCLCQVIAILIEQLSSKEIEVLDGMLNISKVSSIITTKENIKQESDWLELEESHVSIEVLESIINDCVDLFEKAELFELAPHVLKALEINDSGKRIFDSFFRIAFYYLNSNQKMEYIYKMNKLVSLSEMTVKLQAFYPNATFLPADSPALQQIESNSKSINPSADVSGDSNKHTSSNLIIVITHVQPYIENAKNQFEKNVGVQRFVYEQRLHDKIASNVSEQYKKRVILTSSHSFPYFLKRIPIISKEEIILKPIDVAIDEMQERVQQLEHVIMNQDVKHLQLVLQGSIHVTVNCGPLAYANAFLKTNDEIDGDGERSKTDSPDSIRNLDEQPDSSYIESQKHLRFLFEHFLDLCESALKLNERLIKPNQIEYHNNLKKNFDNLKSSLEFLNHRSTYIPIFDAISGSTFA
ncbi:Dedicator of cytokinesis protein 9 [Sarcoptes scabiei]|uniref:Dedicator of cytokinesis protein 9 n=1 Tax=Sarcoptes scabiei TaxID=52283 RepID=A0A834RBW3_SARSC|nr:Dedicator of cytokinesis protein 9 [Sarcoptes scabiei]